MLVVVVVVMINVWHPRGGDDKTLNTSSGNSFGHLTLTLTPLLQHEHNPTTPFILDGRSIHVSFLVISYLLLILFPY